MVEQVRALSLATATAAAAQQFVAYHIHVYVAQVLSSDYSQYFPQPSERPWISICIQDQRILRPLD